MPKKQLKAPPARGRGLKRDQAFNALPAWQRRGMKSTNMLERYNQELKRRTRVVRIFPNKEFCLRLVTALAIEMTEEWLGRRYLIFEDEVSINKTEDILAA